MNFSKQPLVSVIITTYKRSDMLKRAINSVLDQTYENTEVVVVDDNDPGTEARNKTESYMLEYDDLSNVRYVKHPYNMNGAAARNTGIKSSEGEIVGFLDDDDWYLEQKIQKQVSYLLKHPEYDAVYCGWERYNKPVLPNEEGDLTFGILSGTNQVITNTIMMKKEAAVKCGGWDDKFDRNQEAAFLLRYFKCGYKLGVVNELLVKFDMSDRSNASSPKRNEQDFDFYLKVHEQQIDECDAKYAGAKKVIYSYRYRGVLLGYIKYKKLKEALRLYLKLIKYIPIRFNRDLLIYLKDKLRCRLG